MRKTKCAQFSDKSSKDILRLDGSEKKASGGRALNFYLSSSGLLIWHREQKEKGKDFVWLKAIIALHFLRVLYSGTYTAPCSLCSCKLCLWNIRRFFLCFDIVFVCNCSCSRNLVLSIFLVLVSEACPRCSRNPLSVFCLGPAFEASRRYRFRWRRLVMVQPRTR